METLSAQTLEPRKKSPLSFLKGKRPRYYCEHLNIGQPDGDTTFALLPNGALPSSIPESESVRLCQKCMERYKNSLVAA